MKKLILLGLVLMGVSSYSPASELDPEVQRCLDEGDTVYHMAHGRLKNAPMKLYVKDPFIFSNAHYREVLFELYSEPNHCNQVPEPQGSLCREYKAEQLRNNAIIDCLDQKGY